MPTIDPKLLVRCTFLGRNVGGGVSAKMRDRLALVEQALRAEHAKDGSGLTFSQWHGVTSIGGYRKGASFHGAGVAIDIDYSDNGYIVTRTNGTYGGEYAGKGLKGVREAFIAACERACAAANVPCDLSARKEGESTGAAWDRFQLVNLAVKQYLAPYFPSQDSLDVGDADVLPGVVIPPQMQKDYEALRVPLVVGQPVLRPRVMRNPAHGLMSLRRPVVIALCDIGKMRWGMTDFGKAESGDAMHFDCPKLA